MESNNQEINQTFYDLGKALDSLFLWTILNFIIAFLIFPVIVLLIKWIKLIKCALKLSRLLNSESLKRYATWEIVGFFISLVGTTIITVFMFTDIWSWMMTMDPEDLATMDPYAMVDDMMIMFSGYMIALFIMALASGLMLFYAYYQFGIFAEEAQPYFESDYYHQNFVKGIKFLRIGALVDLIISAVTILTFLAFGLDFSGFVSVIALIFQLMGYKEAANALTNQFNPQRTPFAPPQNQIADVTQPQFDEKELRNYEPEFNLDPSFCPQCGRKVDDNERFCMLCGARLRK